MTHCGGQCLQKHRSPIFEASIEIVVLLVYRLSRRHPLFVNKTIRITSTLACPSPLILIYEIFLVLVILVNSIVKLNVQSLGSIQLPIDWLPHIFIHSLLLCEISRYNLGTNFPHYQIFSIVLQTCCESPAALFIFHLSSLSKYFLAKKSLCL